MDEPKIIEITGQPIAAGLVMHTTHKTFVRDMPGLFKRYMDLKEAGKINHLKSPWEYISLSKDFSEDGSWDYYTGYVVTNSGDQIPDLVEFSPPSGLYAVFPIRCRSKLLFPLKVGKTKREIYTQWLPASVYEFSGFEYEYSNEAMAESSFYDIDLYVGIKKKTD